MKFSLIPVQSTSTHVDLDEYMRIQTKPQGASYPRQTPPLISKSQIEWSSKLITASKVNSLSEASMRKVEIKQISIELSKREFPKPAKHIFISHSKE
jgi:hypothetical protein